MRKKLLSIILVALLSTNAIPYTALAESEEGSPAAAEATAGAEEEEATEPTSEEATTGTVKIRMTDAKGGITVYAEEHNGDYTCRKVEFNRDEFVGKDVSFTCETELVKEDDKIKAHIKNCALEGDDADLFELTDTTEGENDYLTVEVYNITHLVDVKPVTTSIALGESVPAVIECVPANDKAEIDTNVKYKCTVKGASGKADVGKYQFNAPVAEHGSYRAQFDKKYTFEVKNGNIDTKSIGFIPKGEHHIRGNDKFKISCSNDWEQYQVGKDLNSFSRSIELQLKKTADGKKQTAYYYLKDNWNNVIKKCAFEYYLPCDTELDSSWISSDGDTVVVSNGGLVTNGDTVIKVLLKRSDNTELEGMKLKAKLNGHDKELSPRELTVSDVDILSLLSTDDEAAEGTPESKNGIISVNYNNINYYYAEFVPDHVADGNTAVYTDMVLSLKNKDEEKEEPIGLAVTANRGSGAGQSKLMMDKKDPVIDNVSTKKAVKVDFDNTKKKINGELSVSDADSGIKTIEYKWDFADDYTKVSGNIDPSAGAGVKAKFETLYSELDEDVSERASFVLDIRVTDNAGNVTEYSQVCRSEWDVMPPKVLYAGFLDDNYRPAMMNMYNYGNYTNKSMKLAIVLQDETDKKFVSGLRYPIMQGKAVKPEMYSIEDVEGLQDFLENVTVDADGKFKITTALSDSWPVDKDSLKKLKKYDVNSDDMRDDPVLCIFEISDISGVFPLNMNFYDRGDMLNSAEINKIVSGMQANGCIYDTEAPRCSFVFEDSNNDDHGVTGSESDYTPDDEGRIWVNENDKFLYIKTNDYSSGIRSILIEKLDANGEVISSKDITVSNTSSVTEKVIKIPLHEDTDPDAEPYLKALTDGKYGFNLVIQDNAGNISGRPTSAKNSKADPVELKVGVYTGSVKAKSEEVSGISKYITKKLWIEDNDNAKLKVKLTGTDAGVKWLSVVVNGVYVDYDYDPVTGILTTNLKNRYTGQKVPCDGTQQYSLSVFGYDHARHGINFTDKIYADLSAPVISRVEAEKTDSIGIQTLNVLTFGVFSNDSVLIKAHVDEPKYDSGLVNVMLNYVDADGNIVPVLMNPSGGGDGHYIYEAELPLGDQIFYNDISIIAEDLCGKINDQKEFNIEGEGGSGKNCAVIEKNAPVISIGFPESDLTGDEETESEEADQENTEAAGNTEAPDEEPKENELIYPHHISNYGDEKAPDEDIWYAEHKHFTVKIHDAQAGISKVFMWINGEEIEDPERFLVIPEKKAGNADENAEANEENTENAEAPAENTEAAEEAAEEERALTDELWFGFDTEELHELLSEQPKYGAYEFKVQALDNAGNLTEAVTFDYNLDVILPEIEKFIFSPASADDIGETQEFLNSEDIPAYTYFFGGKFWAVFRVSDAFPTSGLNRVDYKLLPYADGEGVIDQIQSGSLKVYSETEGLAEDSEEYQLLDSLLNADKERENEEESEPEGIYGYSWLEIPLDFKGQIFAVVYDNVGHNSEEMTTHGYVTDNEDPSIEISGINNTRNSDEDGNKLYSSETEVTVVIRDVKSGIRDIHCAVDSEKRSNDRTDIDLREYDLSGTDDISDGWVVSARDRNLITEVRKTFRFDTDDNGIYITADAGDNSGNHSDKEVSEKFTVDLTEPVIDVEINGGIDDTNYYSAQHRPEVTIKVTERNFDEDLIRTTINNSYGGTVPAVDFRSVSSTEHVAHLVFGEGDFTFDIRGTDRAGHNAKVNMDRSKLRFFMDVTSPVVSSNLKDFAKAENGDYLNRAQNIEITVVEHNFDPERSGLKIWHKDPGSDHDNTGFTDVTNSIVSRANWKSDKDTHTLSAQLKKDGVYRIEVSPVDPSGNSAGASSSGIFELDTTRPEVKEKNGRRVDSSNADKFLDVYGASRKDDAIPTVEFMDANFDHLKYVLTVYAPQYKNGKELAVIRPTNMFLPEDSGQTGTLKNTKFTLPEFDKDGVYALELIAVDKAGNESYLNSNTYMRLVDNDVLAYIPNSNAARKTGWYSFQYENGDPISKRPDNFSDIDIVVFSEKNSDVRVVLRDYNGDEKLTGLRAENDPSLYGVNISRFTLGSDYFRENFRDDTDTELYLSVKNDDARIDLGRLHIDNIEPKCDLPKTFRSWKWFAGNKSRTITVSNIDEQLDMTNCKVYDNGKEIDFEYSPENRSLSFTLDKGWHRVGVKLEDEAGNVYSIQEIDNLYIGYFWLWVILGSAAAAAALIIFIIRRIRRKRLY